MKRTRADSVVCGVLLGALAGWCWAEALGATQPDDATLRKWIADYKSSSEQTKAIAACGVRARDMTLQVLATPVVRTRRGRHSANLPPAIERPKNTRDLFYLLRTLNAPVAIDRLATLVEMGATDSNLPLLLAASGHARARALLQHLLAKAKQSHANEGRNEVRELEIQLQFWQAEHHFITTGTVTEDEITCYRVDGTLFQWRPKPSAPSRAARRVYAQDPTCLDWGHVIDEDYLKSCLAAQAPLLLDPRKCVQSSPLGFGRFHEQHLAQPVLDFLNGDRDPLLSIFGGTLPPPRSFWSSHPARQELAFLEELTRYMTSDAAAQAKLILLRKTRGMRTTGYYLLHCDPKVWLTPYLAEYGSDSAMAGTAITALATASRPLTDAEQAMLPKLLSLPCMRFSYKADQYALPPLARKYPDAFRAALQSPHISREVVGTALAEGLVDDRKLALERIEYGMLHDYETEATVRRPGRRRRPGRSRSTRAPRIQTKWLDVVKTHFAGKEGIDFLHSIAQKPDFARGKSQIEHAIKDMQKR